MRELRASCGGLWSTVSRLVVLALWMGVPATADAQRPDPHHAEEVWFTSGDLTLGGLWFVPEGDAPFPAAVVIGGSGPSRRDSYWARALVAPAVRSAYRLIRAFREMHPDATVRILPGTGHGLWDPGHRDPHRPVLHPELGTLLGEWIRARSRAGGRP